MTSYKLLACVVIMITILGLANSQSWQCPVTSSDGTVTYVDCCGLYCDDELTNSISTPWLCIKDGKVAPNEDCRDAPTPSPDVCTRSQSPRPQDCTEDPEPQQGEWLCPVKSPNSSATEWVNCCTLFCDDELGTFLDPSQETPWSCIIKGQVTSAENCRGETPSPDVCHRDNEQFPQPDRCTDDLQPGSWVCSQTIGSFIYYNNCNCDSFTDVSEFIAIYDPKTRKWVETPIVDDAINPCDDNAESYTIIQVCWDFVNNVPFSDNSNCFGVDQPPADSLTCPCSTEPPVLECTTDYKTFVPCKCDNFYKPSSSSSENPDTSPSCGNTLQIKQICRRKLSNGEFIELPLSACSQSIGDSNSQISNLLDCSCNGQWMCQYQEIFNENNDQTTPSDPSSQIIHNFWGKCSCDSFQRLVWSKEKNTWINTNIDPCHRVDLEGNPIEIDSYSLFPKCLDFSTGQELTSDHCPLPIPNDIIQQECRCDTSTEPVKYEWKCSIEINNTVLIVPCSDVCKYQARYTGCDQPPKPHPVCVRSDLPTVEVNSQFCINSTPSQPTPSIECPPYIAPANCNEYEWKCQVEIQGQLQWIDCNSCDALRQKFPCEEFVITKQCRSLSTLTLVNSSFCSSLPDTSQPPLCPVLDHCNDDTKYHWGCRGYGIRSDGTEVIYNNDSTSVSIFDDNGDIISSRCRCTDTCTGYKLEAICYDSSNQQVNSSMCNPATNPLGSNNISTWCPATLPPEKCDQKPCDKICSVTVNGQKIYFKCEYYKEYCWRLTQNICEGDIYIEQHCGTLTADGQYVPSKDECCKKATTAWPTSTTTQNPFIFNCADILTPIKPSSGAMIMTQDANDLTLFDELAAAIAPYKPCEYAWKCQHPVTGQLVECDCNVLSVSSTGLYCKPFPVLPQCYSRSYGGSWSPNPVPNSQCSSYPQPQLTECPINERCKTQYQWFCTDINGNTTPCTQNPCRGNESCKGSIIQAQCYSSTTSQTLFVPHPNQNDCFTAVGSPFPSTPNTTFFSCPPVPSLCDITVSEYDWQCYIQGNQWLIVPCQCDRIPEKYQEKFGCKIEIVAKCIDLTTLQYVNPSLCPIIPSSSITPTPFPSVLTNTIVCNNCDTDTKKFELKCYLNGNLNQPIPCNSSCKFSGDCQIDIIQAFCYTTPGGINVPLSNCSQLLSALPNFDQNGIRKCESPSYRPGCNAKWMCRTIINGSIHFFDCSNSNVCQNYPFQRSCEQTKVENVCVEYDQNTNDYTIISSNYCFGQGQNPPLGSVNSVALCPSSFGPWCFEENRFDWLCIDPSNPDIEPFPCQKASCKSLSYLHGNPCQPFQVTANCFNIVTLASGAVTYIPAQMNQCLWSSYPILDSQSNPISLSCKCKTIKTCPLNLGVWPNCKINEVDSPVLYDDIIDWNFNPGNPDVEPCADTGVFIRLTPIEGGNQWGSLLFNDDTKKTAVDSSPRLGSGGFKFNNNQIISGSISSSNEPFTARTTIHSICGEYNGPEIDIVPYCYYTKCASPKICDNIQEKCICPPETFGDNCTQKCLDNQIWDEKLQDCICTRGLIWDERQKKCVKKCSITTDSTATDTISRSCGDNGVWSSAKCSCQCKPGYFSNGELTKTDQLLGLSEASNPDFTIPDIKPTKCNCFERYFNITLKVAPENWSTDENIQKLWIKLAESYMVPLPTSTMSDLRTLSLIKIVSTQYNKEDGSLLIIFRFRSCDQIIVQQFIKWYENFINWWNTLDSAPTRDDLIDLNRSNLISGTTASNGKMKMTQSDDDSEGEQNEILFSSFLLSDIINGPESIREFSALGNNVPDNTAPQGNNAIGMNSIVVGLVISMIVAVFF